jgi:predicted dinucleotide-binding enzyme
MSMRKIAVLGSGTVGETLANGCLRHGYAVMRGSREPKKLEAWKAAAKGEAAIGTFAEAAKWGDAVVLALKGLAAEATVTALSAELKGKIVIDACNPIAEGAPDHGVVRYFTAANESLMERLQVKAPGARFVKAFNSVGAAHMVNPKFDATPTMFICGDHADAKQAVTELLGKFGWETCDMGPAPAARPIEALCQLWCLPGFLRNDWSHAFKYLKA